MYKDVSRILPLSRCLRGRIFLGFRIREIRESFFLERILLSRILPRRILLGVFFAEESEKFVACVCVCVLLGFFLDRILPWEAPLPLRRHETFKIQKMGMTT